MKRQIPNIITLTRVPMSVALLFILPLLLQLENIKVPSLILTCILAIISAIKEGHLIRTEDNSSRSL